MTLVTNSSQQVLPNYHRRSSSFSTVVKVVAAPKKVLESVKHTREGLRSRFSRLKGKNRHALRRRLSDLGDRPKPATAQNQQASLFLSKLPLEIRQQIYELVFDDKRFPRVVKDLQLDGGRTNKTDAFFYRLDDALGYHHRRSSSHGSAQIGPLRLPLTCRQM